jgi:hypothetical protein
MVTNEEVEPLVVTVGVYIVLEEEVVGLLGDFGLRGR